MSTLHLAVLVGGKRSYGCHLRWPLLLTSVQIAATTNLWLCSGPLGWQASLGDVLREHELAVERPVLTQELGRADWQFKGRVHGALAALFWLTEREEAQQTAVRE